jgi:hypothetical protein
MITMNLPQFLVQLNEIGDVRVMDRIDTIELHFAHGVNTDDLDDLVCDALFVDPLGREHHERGCTIALGKRDKLRHSSDMRVVGSGRSVKYVC